MSHWIYSIEIANIINTFIKETQIKNYMHVAPGFPHLSLLLILFQHLMADIFPKPPVQKHLSRPVRASGRSTSSTIVIQRLS